MKLKSKFESPGVLIETWESDVGIHDYGIPRSTWLRSCRFVQHFGPDRALAVIDQRAERAADRGDYETARRWRALIAAIHAMQEDVRLPSDNVH